MRTRRRRRRRLRLRLQSFARSRSFALTNPSVPPSSASSVIIGGDSPLRLRRRCFGVCRCRTGWERRYNLQDISISGHPIRWACDFYGINQFSHPVRSKRRRECSDCQPPLKTAATTRSFPCSSGTATAAATTSLWLRQRPSPAPSLGRRTKG